MQVFFYGNFSFIYLAEIADTGPYLYLTLELEAGDYDRPDDQQSSSDSPDCDCAGDPGLLRVDSSEDVLGDVHLHLRLYVLGRLLVLLQQPVLPHLLLGVVVLTHLI